MKVSFGKSRSKLEINIKVVIKEMWLRDMDRTHLNQDRDSHFLATASHSGVSSTVLTKFSLHRLPYNSFDN
jgi:hypothetical protein